jgi:hypothetical protein
MVNYMIHLRLMEPEEEEDLSNKLKFNKYIKKNIKYNQKNS